MHTHSFTYRLRLLSPCRAQELEQQLCDLRSLKHLLSGPLPTGLQTLVFQVLRCGLAHWATSMPSSEGTTLILVYVDGVSWNCARCSLLSRTQVPSLYFPGLISCSVSTSNDGGSWPGAYGLTWAQEVQRQEGHGLPSSQSAHHFSWPTLESSPCPQGPNSQHRPSVYQSDVSVSCMF